jgi:type I restriction enzyme S subunit
MKFPLPKGWVWARCHDVIDVRDGTHDTPQKVESGIPMVTSKNLKPYGIDFNDVTYISEEDYEAIEKRSGVNDGDILFAMIGTIGNPVLVKKDRHFSIKNVALFKIDETKVHASFFKLMLDSPLITQQLEANSRGGNQKFVSLSSLRNMQIPLPPLSEQKRIAAILDKADSIRRKRQGD